MHRTTRVKHEAEQLTPAQPASTYAPLAMPAVPYMRSATPAVPAPMHFYAHKTQAPSGPIKLVPDPSPKTDIPTQKAESLFSSESEYGFTQDLLYYWKVTRDLFLDDVEAYYVRATVRSIENSRKLLISERGYQAAYKTIKYVKHEPHDIFFVRVIHTANPNALFIGCSHAGFTDPECKVVYDCRWASIAVQHARKCYEDPTYDINRVGTMGYTMLSLAVKNCAELAVYWLVRRGASPRAKNADGSDALSICVQMCENKCKYAITECIHERMKLLMLAEKATIRAQDIFVDMFRHAHGVSSEHVHYALQGDVTKTEEKSQEGTKRKRSSRKR